MISVFVCCLLTIVLSTRGRERETAAPLTAPRGLSLYRSMNRFISYYDRGYFFPDLRKRMMYDDDMCEMIDDR